jgi:hypothetical protein
MKELYQKHCLLIMAAVSYRIIPYIRAGAKRTYKPFNAWCHTAPYHTPYRSAIVGCDCSVWSVVRTMSNSMPNQSIREFQTDDRTHHHAHASDHSLTPVQLKEGHSKQS